MNTFNEYHNSSSIPEVRNKAISFLRKGFKQLHNSERDFKLKLLFRGSKFGCSASMFHKTCDNKGPTVTFVYSKEEKKVFGGYTSVSWTSPKEGGIYAQDKYAFVFSLTNETYHPVKRTYMDKAVWHHKDSLVYFGCYDFFLKEGCMEYANIDLDLGYYYELGENVIGDWVGHNSTHLAGSKKYIVEEIEIYKV